MTRLLPILLTSCALLLTGAAIAQSNTTPEASFQEKIADHELLKRMQRGGFVLYMRHGTTDNSRADRVPKVDLNDCSTQRILNEDGRQVAVAIGKAFQKAYIPVSEIFHSPLCRTTETVKLAFPGFKGPIKVDNDLMYTANLTTEEKKPVLAATRRLVSTLVPPGTNRLIVAHAPNMADLMGYFVKPEGTVVVLRPLGAEKFEYLASIPPSLWPQLLK